MPTPYEGLKEIDVSFDLPDEWDVVTPWSHRGDHWRPGIAGGHAAEDLVSASVGLGRFHERIISMGKSRCRLVVPEQLASDADDIEATLSPAIRRLRFRSDPTYDYTILAVTRSPEGDQVIGEGWATGQAGTLLPLTSSRIQLFAKRLLDADLRYSPSRVELRNPQDYWLIDGLIGYLALQAIADCGLSDGDQIRSSLVARYIKALENPGAGLDLEKLYSSVGSHRIEREVIAPTVVALLDHRIRRATNERDSVEAFFDRLTSRSGTRSIASAIGSHSRGLWEDMQPVIRGEEAIPAEELVSLRQTSRDPELLEGGPVRHLTIAFTGKSEGFLEHCGCKSGQSGGLARRATVIDSLRQSDGRVLLLDSGSTVRNPVMSQSKADPLAIEEHRAYVRGIKMLGYDAIAVGASELSLPLGSWSDSDLTALPFVVANLQVQGRQLAPLARSMTIGGLRVAIIGLFEAPRQLERSTVCEERVTQFLIADPVATAKASVARLRDRNDLLVVVGELEPITIRRLVDECPDLDLVVSAIYEAPTISVDSLAMTYGHADRDGFLGQTLVAHAHLGRYGLASVRIGINDSGRIASADFREHWLREDVPDHKGVRHFLNRFYERVGKLPEIQKAVEGPFAGDSSRMQGRYVGANTCATCHTSEYKQWANTPHAIAYKTLLDRHRHFHPECVSCHVVGYGTASGYQMGSSHERLAGVQCESCHGPGGNHAQAPSPRNIQRRVPAAACLQCHRPDHSDDFSYVDRLPRVLHSPSGLLVSH